VKINIPLCSSKSELKELNVLTDHVGFSMEPTDTQLKFALATKITGKLFLEVFFFK